MGIVIGVSQQENLTNIATCINDTANLGYYYYSAMMDLTQNTFAATQEAMYYLGLATESTSV